MRLLFIILIFAHGLIHILGFIKAYRLADISQLTQHITKPLGTLWLLTVLLLISVAFYVLFGMKWWWMPAIIAIVTSQILIIVSWHDAKYGTIPNIIILLVVILGIATWNANIQTNKEFEYMLAQADIKETTVITNEMLESLPLPAQKWLNKTGIVGKEKIQTLSLKQVGLMKLKPDQKEWSESKAEQYITTNNPAFLWKVNMSMLPLVSVSGRDLFIDGQGTMKISIASFIPVVNAVSNDKINQSALARYLMELPWYPSAAINSYISWVDINNYSSQATITYKGVSASAIFYYDESGTLVKVSALRYKDSDENAKLMECIGVLKENQTIAGLTIPTKVEISWVLEEGEFMWYTFDIFDVEFNNRDLDFSAYSSN